MIPWQPISDYIEPRWNDEREKVSPMLFWRPSKGATLGFIREGELFSAASIYVCDANKVSHFAVVTGPAENVVDLATKRAEKGN